MLAVLFDITISFVTNVIYLDYLEHMMDKFGSRAEFYHDCGMIYSNLSLHTTLLIDSKSMWKN